MATDIYEAAELGGSAASIMVTTRRGREAKVPLVAMVLPGGGVPGGSAASTPLAGTLAVSGVVGPFVPELNRPIVLVLKGVWAGTVQLLRSTDGGATMQPRTYGDGTPKPTWTGPVNAPVDEETVAGATYYLSFVRTSGTLDYRMAQ